MFLGAKPGCKFNFIQFCFNFSLIFRQFSPCLAIPPACIKKGLFPARTGRFRGICREHPMVLFQPCESLHLAGVTSVYPVKGREPSVPCLQNRIQEWGYTLGTFQFQGKVLKGGIGVTHGVTDGVTLPGAF